MSSRDIQIYFWRRKRAGEDDEEKREVARAGVSNGQAAEGAGRRFLIHYQLYIPFMYYTYHL